MGSHEDAFRRRVKYEREERGWSQADLARKLNDRGGKFYASTIAKIENIAGSRPRSIRLDEAMQIANALDMTIDDLLGYQIDPKYSIDDRIKRVDKTMTEIAVEIQNRTSQLEIEKLAIAHLCREIAEDLESAIITLTQERFGEIYSDDPKWQEAIAIPEISNDPDLETARAQLLGAANAGAALHGAIDSLRQGTTELFGAWIGRDDISVLIREFKYRAKHDPELGLFTKIDQMRKIGALHSLYDSIQDYEEIEE